LKFSEVSSLLAKASRDRVLRTGLARSIKSYMGKRRFAEEASELASRVREAKEEAIPRLKELAKQAADSIEDNGGVAYIARTAEEARRIAGELVGSGKLVVKAKSMTTEEVELREHLERLGNEVWETDLGEFIIQLLGSKPMHFTSPAIHVTREEVAELFRRKLNAKVGDSIPELAKAAREFLREKFLRADVGVTGANAIAADSGMIFTLENEANVRLASALPEKHIVVAGVEKVYRTSIEAWMAVEVTMRYAGYKSTSYVNVVASPSKTGDIEKTVVYGAHGPRELHVILVDNGRYKASEDPVLKEALYCLRCGACQYMCPVFKITGGYWGGKVYVGGIGVIWTAITGSIEEAMLHSYACLLCGRCIEACPLKIDQPKMIRELRRRRLSSLKAR